MVFNCPITHLPNYPMRLFLALDIDPEIRGRIAQFMDGVRGFAPDARWVSAESLHITLKFIGEWPPEKLEDLQRALAGVRGQPAEITFSGTGFFPTAKSARVFWIGIQAGPELALLAGAADAATAGGPIQRTALGSALFEEAQDLVAVPFPS